MNRPTRITFPKRWSREKRKEVRARVMAAQWRAWYWQQVTASLKETLNAVWADAMKKPFDWESCGFEPAEGEFVDDNTFLVTP